MSREDESDVAKRAARYVWTEGDMEEENTEVSDEKPKHPVAKSRLRNEDNQRERTTSE